MSAAPMTADVGDRVGRGFEVARWSCLAVHRSSSVMSAQQPGDTTPIARFSRRPAGSIPADALPTSEPVSSTDARELHDSK